MNIFRAGLVLGASTAVRTVANLITVKLIATHLGTAGMGFLGQFMSVMAITSTIGGGGTSVAITKYVAEFSTRPSELAPYLRAAVVIWGAFSVAFLIGVAFQANRLSTLLFDSSEYDYVFWGLGVCQFAIGAYNLLLAYVSGRKEVKRYAIANISLAIFGVALTSFLIIKWGLKGAIWGLLLVPTSGVLFATWAVLGCRDGLAGWTRAKVRGQHYKRLLAYSGMVVVSILTMPTAHIILRDWQASESGWQQVGVWQGLIKLSDVYLQFIMIVLSNYYLPRLSESKTHEEMHRHVMQTLAAGAAVLIPAVFVIWLLRDWIVVLVFSPDFVGMNSLFGPQLVGDVFKTLAYILGFVTVAKARSGIYIGAEVFQAATLLVISYALLPHWKGAAVPYAYCATYMAYFAVCASVYARYHRGQSRSANL
jgi:antigen flippase